MTKPLSYDEAACKLLGVKVLPYVSPQMSFKDDDPPYYAMGLSEYHDLELGHVVCQLMGLSLNDWPNFPEKKRLILMRLALDKKRLVARLPENQPTGDKKKPGRRSNPTEDARIYKEYYDGLENGEWDTQVDYLKKKHRKRYNKNSGAAKSWFSTLLKRVEERGKDS